MSVEFLTNSRAAIIKYNEEQLQLTVSVQVCTGHHWNSYWRVKRPKVPFYKSLLYFRNNFPFTTKISKLIKKKTASYRKEQSSWYVFWFCLVNVEGRAKTWNQDISQSIKLFSTFWHISSISRSHQMWLALLSKPETGH